MGNASFRGRVASSEQRNDEEPKLYRLLRRGDACNWAAVEQRLEEIRNADRSGATTEPSGGRRRGAFFSWDRWGAPSEIANGDGGVGGAYGELTWRHPSSGVTALHVVVCWNPPVEVLRSMVGIPSSDGRPIALSKSDAGATPLHYACSCASQIDTVRTLVNSIPTVSEYNESCVVTGGDDEGFDGEERRTEGHALETAESYVLLQTLDTYNTALHSAMISDAPFDVVKFLIETNPRIVLVRNEHGLTALDLLCKIHRLVLVVMLEWANVHHQNEEEAHDDDAKYDGDVDATRDLPPRLHWLLGRAAGTAALVSDDGRLAIVRDFWIKSTLLLRTAASLVSDTGAKYVTNDNLLHAVASLPSHLYGCMCPPLLLQLLLVCNPGQLRRRDGASGDLPLHVAARVASSSFCTGVKAAPPDESLKRCVRRASSSIEPDGFCDGSVDSNNDPSSCQWSVVDQLLSHYPRAIMMRNGEGRLPFEVAVRGLFESPGCSLSPGWWKREENHIRSILFSNPAATLVQADLPDKLLPLILSRIRCGRSEDAASRQREDWTAVFQIVRSVPIV